MKLYGSFTSPYVRHCRVAVIEEGFECEFCEADTNLSAKLSPMQRVPFMVYQEEGSSHVLTDSTAILKFIRNSRGKTFLDSVDEMNRYFSATTLLDSAINLFFLEKDGVLPSQSSYLARQRGRIETGLQAFEAEKCFDASLLDEASLRLACFLDWALFRERITLEPYPALREFLSQVKSNPAFSQTSPE